MSIQKVRPPAHPHRNRRKTNGHIHLLLISLSPLSFHSSLFIVPFPVFPKALFLKILRYPLIATIAVNGIDIVEITTTLAPFLGTLWLSLNGQPCPTLGTVGRIREILEMATGASIARTEAGTTVFTEFRILLIGFSTASTFHGDYSIDCSNAFGKRETTPM